MVRKCLVSVHTLVEGGGMVMDILATVVGLSETLLDNRISGLGSRERRALAVHGRATTRNGCNLFINRIASILVGAIVTVIIRRRRGRGGCREGRGKDGLVLLLCLGNGLLDSSLELAEEGVCTRIDGRRRGQD
jgi:hypothetical protein